MKQVVLSNTQSLKLGKLPAVILSLNDYEKMKEDLEMFNSKRLPKDIAKARREAEGGETLSIADVKKRLRLK